mgnify:CR=1 FL=1
MTQEERVKVFKEMLKEKNLPRLATWQKTMSLLIFDPRFKGIPCTLTCHVGKYSRVLITFI